MRYNRDMGRQLEDSQTRKRMRRDDLLKVADTSGLSKSDLANPTPWYELGRGQMWFEPDRRLVAMVRDVARKARERSTISQQRDLRTAVSLYCLRLRDEMLEPLGPEESSTDVVELFSNTEKEHSEAICAGAQALQAPNPQTDERAAREFEEAALAHKQTAEGLRNRIRRTLGDLRQW